LDPAEIEIANNEYHCTHLGMHISECRLDPPVQKEGRNGARVFVNAYMTLVLTT